MTIKHKIFCKCCNTQTNYVIDVFARWHLKKYHNMTMKEYYDRFLKKDGEGIGVVCQKQTTYFLFRVSALL